VFQKGDIWEPQNRCYRDAVWAIGAKHFGDDHKAPWKQFLEDKNHDVICLLYEGNVEAFALYERGVGK